MALTDTPTATTTLPDERRALELLGRLDLRDAERRTEVFATVRGHAVRVAPGPRRRWELLVAPPLTAPESGRAGYVAGWKAGRTIVGAPLGLGLFVAGVAIEVAIVLGGAVTTAAAGIAAVPGAVIGGVIGRVAGALTGNPHGARNGSAAGAALAGAIVGIPLGLAWAASTVVLLSTYAVASVVANALTKAAGLAGAVTGAAAGRAVAIVRPRHEVFRATPQPEAAEAQRPSMEAAAALDGHAIEAARLRWAAQGRAVRSTAVTSHTRGGVTREGFDGL